MSPELQFLRPQIKLFVPFSLNLIIVGQEYIKNADNLTVKHRNKRMQLGNGEKKRNKHIKRYLTSLAPREKQIKTLSRASLVVQWIRIRLPVQGIQVQSLVQEDPTCRGATKPMCHNY